MPNHFHLLIEMQEDPVSRIMQRVLTSYSQYHNRKYRKVGHLCGAQHKPTCFKAATRQYSVNLISTWPSLSATSI